VAGAYDDAVKGVKYVVHVASPFASPDLMESQFETGYIQPAIQGTVGILDSALKTKGIERIVITSSIVAIASFAVAGTGVVIDGRCLELPSLGFVLRMLTSLLLNRNSPQSN